MRWLFERIEETGEKYVYRYARESDDMDGVIEYSKDQKTAIMVKPCSNDRGSEWCIEKSIGKFIVFISEEGFPRVRNVITG